MRPTTIQAITPMNLSFAQLSGAYARSRKRSVQNRTVEVGEISHDVHYRTGVSIWITLDCVHGIDEAQGIRGEAHHPRGIQRGPRRHSLSEGTVPHQPSPLRRIAGRRRSTE